MVAVQAEGIWQQSWQEATAGERTRQPLVARFLLQFLQQDSKQEEFQ